jgi:hypothetical protein
MDVGILLNCLSKINTDNIHATYHFQERIDQRKSEIHPDLNEIYSILLKEQPVGILKQEEGKFKLYYERTEKYDLIIIVSIKSTSPLILNLVTCFLEDAKKRRRPDETGISGN